MAEIDLDAIHARADAATPRPWHQAEGAAHVVDLDSEAFFVHHDDRRAAAPDECADAEFIAHARSDIPALLDEVARLQGHCMGREGALRIVGRQIEEFRAERDALAAVLSKLVHDFEPHTDGRKTCARPWHFSYRCGRPADDAIHQTPQRVRATLAGDGTSGEADDG